ncbi:hypothetical protein J6590_040095 [Homalodisca vitripennis]|nr:hypothetical protein J6590_040095 [Homalodisca vitripennis]
MEVRDLEERTTEADVDNAIIYVLGDDIELKTFVSKADSREQKMALLIVAEGYIKIGAALPSSVVHSLERRFRTSPSLLKGSSTGFANQAILFKVLLEQANPDTNFAPQRRR